MMLDLGQTAKQYNIFCTFPFYSVLSISPRMYNASINISQRKFAKSDHLKLFCFYPYSFPVPICIHIYIYVFLVFFFSLVNAVRLKLFQKNLLFIALL